MPGSHFSSNTSRMVLAISRITIGFITKALIPISFALFSSICSLNPVEDNGDIRSDGDQFFVKVLSCYIRNGHICAHIVSTLLSNNIVTSNNEAPRRKRTGIEKHNKYTADSMQPEIIHDLV